MTAQRILAICDNHDAGAVLFDRDKLSGAINEERLNRIKMFQGFPEQSINHLLKSSGLKPKDIDLVVVGSIFTPCFALRVLNNLHRKVKGTGKIQFSLWLKMYVIYQVACHKVPFLREMERTLSTLHFQRIFRRKGFRCKVQLVDHHFSHAYSAHCTSGLSKTLVVSMDAMGDGVGIGVYLGQGTTVKTLYTQSGFSAPGFFYSRITEILGFKPNRHEGKITGLAAYGDHRKLYGPMKELFSFSNGTIHESLKKKPYFAFQKYPREHVAAACQKVFEEAIIQFVEHWVQKTGVHDICLVGGVFQNVKLNQHIHESHSVHSTYVFPHMGDGGLALGALYSVLQPEPRQFSTLFLGPEEQITKQELQKLLKEHNLKIIPTENLAKDVAELLASGKMVGVHMGKQEFGPRALCNHSILCKTDNPELHSILNDKLARTEFMPFAPVTLDTHAQDCYQHLKGAEYSARFMTMAFSCSDYMKTKSPCVVHIDNTARPQILRKQDQPFAYEVLRHYFRITGIPSLLNTSFNVHEEPIVFSAESSIKTFLKAKLDYLVLDDMLLKSVPRAH